jgi:hypothetical protein
VCEGEWRIIETLVKVGDGPTSIRMAARAESIRRAMEAARAHYPGAGVRVVYPIDPKAFFVRDSAAPVGLVRFEMPEKVAG